MFIFQLIETVYNVVCVLAYISVALWIIGAVANTTRYIKKRKKGK